jgi:hypothetical protein
MMTLTRRVVVAVAVVLLCAAMPLVAQDQPTEFRPILPGELEQEQIPAARLVIAAYAFVWATFVVYLFLLWSRVKRVEGDLRDVTAKLGGRRG